MGGKSLSMRTLQLLSGPGIGSDLMLHEPAEASGAVLLWLPGMGMPARQYKLLAEALAVRGMGTALHEWRGIGSSSVRASRHEDWGYRELLTRDLPAAIKACRLACPEARVLIGGHSLGGQLACLFAALHPADVDGVVVVASGVPYWRCFRAFGGPLRAAVALMDWTARLKGHYPGRRVGFAGNEARGVIADWTRSARTGNYAARGLDEDLEAALATLTLPLLTLRMQDDRLAPESSLRYLLAKMPHAPSEMHVIDADMLGARADHFAWIESPSALAERIVSWNARLD